MHKTQPLNSLLEVTCPLNFELFKDLSTHNCSLDCTLLNGQVFTITNFTLHQVIAVFKPTLFISVFLFLVSVILNTCCEIISCLTFHHIIENKCLLQIVLFWNKNKYFKHLPISSTWSSFYLLFQSPIRNLLSICSLLCNLHSFFIVSLKIQPFSRSYRFSLEYQLANKSHTSW